MSFHQQKSPIYSLLGPFSGMSQPEIAIFDEEGSKRRGNTVYTASQQDASEDNEIEDEGPLDRSLRLEKEIEQMQQVVDMLEKKFAVKTRVSKPQTPKKAEPPKEMKQQKERSTPRRLPFKMKVERCLDSQAKSRNKLSDMIMQKYNTMKAS